MQKRWILMRPMRLTGKTLWRFQRRHGCCAVANFFDFKFVVLFLCLVVCSWFCGLTAFNRSCKELMLLRRSLCRKNLRRPRPYIYTYIYIYMFCLTAVLQYFVCMFGLQLQQAGGIGASRDPSSDPFQQDSVGSPQKASGSRTEWQGRSNQKKRDWQRRQRHSKENKGKQGRKVRFVYVLTLS